jgi:hypothetical protein
MNKKLHPSSFILHPSSLVTALQLKFDFPSNLLGHDTKADVC